MTDSLALERYAATQDPEAFAHLVQRYGQMVYATCLRTLGHATDAEDAAQDTFVQLATSAGSIRSNAGAWLHRTATNVSISRMRSAGRRRAREAAVATPERVDDATLAVEWAEIRDAVDATLAAMPDESRALIVQRYLVGRTQADLAAERGVSASMMSRRVNAAVEGLRARLRSKGFAAGAGAGVLTAGFAADSMAAVPAALGAEFTKIGVAGVTGAAGGSGSVVVAAGTGKGGAAGWLWIGAKVKLSTAVIGSLSIHAVIVGIYLWAGWGGLSVLPAPLSGRPFAKPAPTQSPPAAQHAQDPERLMRASTVDPPAPLADGAAADEPGFVHIMGDIQHPGAYTLRNDELTLKQLIASAGGKPIDGRLFTLTRRGNAPQGQPDEETVVRTTLAEAFNGPLGDTVLQEGDLVNVLPQVIAEAGQDVEEPVADQPLTGIWVLLIEDRDGNLVEEGIDPLFRRARFNFIKGTTLVEIKPADGAQEANLLMEIQGLPANAVAGTFQEIINAKNPSFGEKVSRYFLEGWSQVRSINDRAYLGGNVLNPATQQREQIAPGDFDARGQRRILVRPTDELLGSDRAGLFVSAPFDSALAGEWVALTENKEGDPAPKAFDPWLWESHWVFAGDELTIRTEDGTGTMRWRRLRGTGLDGVSGVFLTLLASEGIFAVPDQFRGGVPPRWKDFRVEGKRAYAWNMALNPETQQMAPVPAGAFDSRGFRLYFVRPNVDTTQSLPDAAPSPKEAGVAFRSVLLTATDPTAVPYVPEGSDQPVYVSPQSIVSGRDFVSASVVKDPSVRPAVQVEIAEKPGQRLYEYTRNHIGQRMAIVVEGRVVSTPTIVASLRRSGQITGLSTEAEAEELAAFINQQAAEASVDP